MTQREKSLPKDRTADRPYRQQDDNVRGGGDRGADRRYRESVRKTVDDIAEKERAAHARRLKEEEKSAARDAESTRGTHSRR